MSDPDLDTRRRKQLIAGGVSSILLILLVACVANVIYNSNDSDDSKPLSEGIHTSSKSVDMLCTSTDYKETCQETLSKTIKSDDPEPRDLVHAAISVIFDKIGAAFNKTDNIKTTDEKVKGAIEDCKELFISSKDELKDSLDSIVDKGIDHLPSRQHDVKTWLSAVLSYQQTCVDGFPEGELKEKLEKAMQMAREVTSNALVIVEKAAKFISVLNVDGLSGQRRLLEDDEGEDMGNGAEEFPSWVTEGDRRSLKEGMHLTLVPNVTVAKDGSGDFKTINSALAAMPTTYKGRYVCLGIRLSRTI